MRLDHLLSMENVHGAETRLCVCSGEVLRKRLLFNFQGESLRVGVKSRRVHPFPFRTRKLSSAEPKILYRRRYGKIGRCRHSLEAVQFGLPQKGKPRDGHLWGCSSAGRAPALQAGGHGFESHHLHQQVEKPQHLNGLIAQLVRAPA